MTTDITDLAKATCDAAIASSSFQCLPLCVTGDMCAIGPDVFNRQSNLPEPDDCDITEVEACAIECSVEYCKPI
jgi:hypothetical protein